MFFTALNPTSFMWTNLRAPILLQYHLDTTTVTFSCSLSIRDLSKTLSVPCSPSSSAPLVNGSVVTLESIGKHIVARTWHCRDTHDIDESSSDLLERFGWCRVGGEQITIVLYLFTRGDWIFDFLTWDDLVSGWTLAQFVSVYVAALCNKRPIAKLDIAVLKIFWFFFACQDFW